MASASAAALASASAAALASASAAALASASAAALASASASALASASASAKRREFSLFSARSCSAILESINAFAVSTLIERWNLRTAS